MLAEPDLDVVSICSYHHQHKEHILAAAKAGKHNRGETAGSLTEGPARD